MGVADGGRLLVRSVVFGFGEQRDWSLEEDMVGFGID